MAGSDDKVFMTYTGENGDSFFGVPPRDITKAEFDSLTPFQQRDVLAGTIYSPVSTGSSKKTDDTGSSGSGSENK